MNTIVENFPTIAEIYMRVLALIYLSIVSFIFSFWLKPFTVKHKAAYISAVVFWVLRLIHYMIPVGNIYSKLILYTIIFLVFIVSWLLDEKRNPWQKLFLSILFYLVTWLTYEISVEISSFEENIITDFNWYNSSVNAVIIVFFVWNFIDYVIAVLLFLLVMYFLQKVYRRKYEELSWQEFLMLLTPFCTFLVVKPIMIDYFTLWMDGIGNGSIKENIPASIYRLLFCVLSLVSVMVIITLYQKIKESKENEFERQALENKIDDTQRHIEKVEEMYDKMRSIRHDMGNHLTVIEGLAQNNKTEELSEYVSELKNRFIELQPTIKTGNAVTDVVLSEYNDLCKKEGIEFECEFVYPSNLGINSFDMSVILTNALQNAYEASKKIDSPSIRIVSIIREKFFIISIKNTADEKKMVLDDGIPHTTKTEIGHGYGLKNIKSIAQKYNGDLEIRKENEEGKMFFVLNVMLMG